MKPNEITQRDIEKWTRGSPPDHLCSTLDAAEPLSCGDADLAEAYKTFERFAAKSRLADLGEQTSALAHELRQPLFSIAVANESLRMLLGQLDHAQPQMTKAVSRIAEQVQRAQTIIDHTLAYASGRVGAAVRGDVGLAAANAVQFLRPLFDASDVEIDDRLARTPAAVALSQVEIEQVFVNILRNAAESVQQRREGGWLGCGHVGMRIAVIDGRVKASVSDNGAGLSAQDARSAFEPFFTTKPRIGTGLGLHICRKVLSKVGGTVILEPGKVEGARVDIELPLAVED